MFLAFITKIRSRATTQWVVFLILTLFFIAINAPYFRAVWVVDSLPGYDGASHAAVGEYYAKHIFPSAAGWIPQWFGGFPFPQLYSPLFYFVAALLYWVLPFSYIFTLKALVTFTALSIPYLISRIARALGGGVRSQWFAGLTAVILSSTFYSIYGNDGLNLQGTFNVGLVTQTFGYVFFLVWFELFLKARVRPFYKYASALLLTLLMLTNTHIVVPTALILLFFGARDAFDEWRSRKTLEQTIVFYLVAVALPCLMAAFWYIPMFSYWHYLTGIGLDHSGVEFMYVKRYAFNIAALAIYLFISRKQWRSSAFTTSLALLVLVLIALAPVGRLLHTNIPLHTYRYLAFFAFTSLPLTGLVFERFSKKMNVFAQCILVTCCAIPFIFFYFAGNNGDRYNAFYFDDKKDEISSIADYLKDKKERITVEVDSEETRVPARALNALLGTRGATTDFTVFSEVAISSIFMPFVENSFSTYRVALPAYSPLQTYSSFLDVSLETRINRAKEFGVKYIVARSIRMTRVLEKSPRIELLKDFGTWKIFSIKEDVPLAIIPHYQPTLFFGELNFKDRTAFNYDFTTVNEALFQGGAESRTVVYAHDQRLDVTPDLHAFDSLFIASYRYKNLNVAFKRLVEYAKNRKIMLVESANPLFLKLRDLHAGNIALVPTPKDMYWNVQNIQNRLLLSKLISTVQTRIPDGGKSIPTRWIGDCMSVSISGSQITPVLIRSSYFPSFKTTSRTPLYLATPTFMFGNFKNAEKICFGTDKIIPAGYAVSLIGLGTLMYLYRRERKLLSS